jgi:transcriptional regulator with XRE-family HTH domain
LIAKLFNVVLIPTMRKSPHRHVLALLRDALRMRQKEFAEFLDIKPHILRDIELAKRPLPVSIAHRIARKTGVSEEWLLANQLDIPVPEDLTQRMKERRVRMESAKNDLEKSIDLIIRDTDNYPFEVLKELSAVAQKRGCREESEVGQLRWLYRLSYDLAKGLEQYESEMADLAKKSPDLF